MAFSNLLAQKKRSPEWYELMDQPAVNFYTIKESFKKYEKKNADIRREQHKQGKQAEKEEDELPGFEIYKRWEYFMEPRVYPSGNRSLLYSTKAEFENYDLMQSGVLNRGPGGGTGHAISTVSNWTFVGPSVVPGSSGGAGRINFIRIDPSNTSVIYVGSPGGGFWKTTNGGNTWTTTTDFLSVVGATDLVIDHTNSSVLFLATGDGDASDTYSAGVFKSTDAGATWSPTGLQFLITSTYVIRRLLMDPSNHNILYAATSSGIYKTVDAGASWTAVVSGSFKDMEFNPANPSILYATTSTQFYRSTNSGASWTIVSNGLPGTSSVNRLAIGVSPASPSTVYVLASSSSSNFNGVYRSTDNGLSFSTQSTTPNILGYDTGGDTGGQGWYDLAIAVSPTNINDIMVGGVNQWRSTNGGVNWTQRSHWYGGFGFPYVHADVHALEFQPGSSTIIYSGNDGGIFKSTNNGSTWTDISSNLAIKQYYKIAWSPTSTNKIMGGTQDNGTDQYNGSTWTRVLGGDGMDCMYDFNNSNILYAELYYGSIYKSTNGGSTFSNIVGSGGTNEDEGGAWVTPMAMSPASSSTLYIGKTQVYKSTNSGSSWSTVGSISGGSGKIIALALSAANSNYVYAAKSDRFFVSTNGTSFTDRTSGLPTGSASITSIAASSTDANLVWVTFSGYSSGNKVYYSSDAGNTWINVSNNLPNLPVNCISYRAGSNSEVYIGADVGVYVMDANMNNWQPFYTNLPNCVVTDIEINNSLNKIRIGTFGRGIWESPIPVLNSIAADFSANVLESCTGSPVIFTNISYGSVSTYSWNFGSGATPSSSTSPGPVAVTYATGGLKTISLTVTGPAGSNSITKTNYISAFTPPAAAGNISGPATLCSNSVTGKTYSIASVSGATTYKWTVPTGASIVGGQGSNSITVNFGDNGGTVSVTASNGSCASATQKLTVSMNKLPQVNAGTDQSICAGSSATLIATSASQGGSHPLRFTEISHFLGGTGKPSVIPDFLEYSSSDDYLEITNLGTGSVNAGGLVIQRWTGTSLSLSYTIPVNTILPAGQPLVIHYGSGTNDPDNFYFRGGGSANAASSTTAAGYVIKSGSIIVDAVAVNGYSFPGSSGVLSTDWSGSIASMNGLSGCLLTGDDLNNSTTWSLSASASPLTSFGFLNPALSPYIEEPATVSWTTIPSSGFNAGGYTVSSGVLNTTTTFKTAITNLYSSCTNSDTVVVNVSPSGIAGVSISANPAGAICSGTNVTFTAIPVNGGSPIYQWKRNGTIVGNNSNTYSNNSLSSGDQITCTMTSSGTCVTGNPAISNTISMNVTAPSVAAVSISANPGTTICAGTSVQFSAAPINGGIPIYQWKKNGVNAGTNSSTYNDNALNIGDQVQCIMTSSLSCVSNSPAISNTVVMNVSPVVLAGVTINASPPSAVCAGTNVFFTANPVNGGTPSYQWKKNGGSVGTNSQFYTDNSLTSSDQVICEMTSTANCAIGNPATSNIIVKTVNPLPAVVFMNPTQGLAGTAVTLHGDGFINVGSVKFNSIAATFSTVNSTEISATVPVNATTGFVTIVTACGTAASDTFIVIPATLTLNLHLLIQGFYKGGGTLTSIIGPGLCDTITLELHNMVWPYEKVASASGTIGINGSGSFEIPDTYFNGSYYLVIRHRNAIETWSSLPVTLNSSSISYDFADSQSKAFGNNMIDLLDGYFALYNGDINQDGVINLNDLDALENLAWAFVAGYQPGDLTGDGLIESSDYSVVENNSRFGIAVMRP